MTDRITIHWFRNDLRIDDNPALTSAAKAGSILPVYIYDTSAPEWAQLGGASKWWLHHSLQALNASLDGNLLVLQGEPLQVLTDLIKQSQANAIVWNRGYEPWQIQRDIHIKQALKDQGLEVLSCNGHLLWEPMSVLKKDGTPYKVFTPYYRKGCLAQPEPRFPLEVPELKFAKYDMKGLDIEDLQLLPTISWDTQIRTMWEPGTLGAKAKLARYIQEASDKYQDARNLPAVKGTSQLSPYLHFGEISVNQVWYALKDAYANDPDNPHLDTFLSELGWREFSHYLLYHWPSIPTDNFNNKFDAFPWRDDTDALKAWQTGHTGVPIVDAGMRELWQTGYMHNRVRMIVGSFLVKNLLLDWREGERWFWDCLLDADMAANSASWQWVAGSGADAAPYFRVFNPVLQGEKFDKQGEYVKQYCPELKRLPPKYIHQPWTAPQDILRACQITLGKDYPKPIVDLKQSRQRALDAFQQMKALS